MLSKSLNPLFCVVSTLSILTKDKVSSLALTATNPLNQCCFWPNHTFFYRSPALQRFQLSIHVSLFLPFILWYPSRQKKCHLCHFEPLNHCISTASSQPWLYNPLFQHYVLSGLCLACVYNRQVSQHFSPFTMLFYEL